MGDGWFASKIYDDGPHEFRKTCSKGSTYEGGSKLPITIFYLPRTGKPEVELTYSGPDTYFLEVIYNVNWLAC